jgi:hypothetical protein
VRKTARYACPPATVVEGNPIDSRGIGEIGITGAAAALANAIYNATGERIISDNSREAHDGLDRLNAW